MGYIFEQLFRKLAKQSVHIFPFGKARRYNLFRSAEIINKKPVDYIKNQAYSSSLLEEGARYRCHLSKILVNNFVLHSQLRNSSGRININSNTRIEQEMLSKKDSFLKDLISYHSLSCDEKGFFKAAKVKEVLINLHLIMLKVEDLFETINFEPIISKIPVATLLHFTSLSELCGLLLSNHPNLVNYNIAQLKYMNIVKNDLSINQSLIIPLYMKCYNKPNHQGTHNTTLSTLSTAPSEHDTNLVAPTISTSTSNAGVGFKAHMKVKRTNIMISVSLTFKNEKTFLQQEFNLQNPVTIGDENCTFLYMKDPGFDSQQLKIELADKGMHIQCTSDRYLTLLSIEGIRRYALCPDDYFIMSDSEGFIIKEMKNYQPNQKAIEEEYYKSDSKYLFPRIDPQNIGNSDTKTQPNLKILFTKGEKERRICELHNEDESFVLGRGDQCDIKFINKEISKYHAKIEFDKKLNIWILYQPQGKSRNGTWLALNTYQNKKEGRPSEPLFIPRGNSLTLKASYTIMKLHLQD